MYSMSCLSLSPKIAVILLRVTDIGNNDSASFALLCLTLLSGILQLETIKLSFSQPALGPGYEEVEKEALLQFKQNLTDLSRRLLSWVGDDCCSWRGVSCNNRTASAIMLNLNNTFWTRVGSQIKLLKNHSATLSRAFNLRIQYIYKIKNKKYNKNILLLIFLFTPKLIFIFNILISVYLIYSIYNRYQ